MENDLINRQQAIDSVMELIEARYEWMSDASREICALNAAYCAIEDVPAVDAVPVIHCKDCKWYGRADKRRFYRGMDCLQNRIDTIVSDKDYCSRAERRTDGNG